MLVLIEKDFFLSLYPVSKPISEIGSIPKFSLRPNLYINGIFPLIPFEIELF